MNRRSLLLVIASGVGSAVFRRIQTSARDTATPDANPPIPPIRWNLASIDAEESTITPDEPARYWIQFLDDGDVHIGADCNSASGTYEVDGESISITDIVSTLAMCDEDSIDQEFLSALSAATAYSISSDGSDQLVLAIGDDGESAVLSAALTGVVWRWEHFAAGNDTTITPSAPDQYTIEFLDDGSIHVVADCNRGGGQAVVEGNQVDLTVAMTRVACGEDSSSDDFMRLLDEATSLAIRDGWLHLALPMDAGIASFRAIVPQQPGPEATPDV